MPGCDPRISLGDLEGVRRIHRDRRFAGAGKVAETRRLARERFGAVKGNRSGPKKALQDPAGCAEDGKDCGFLRIRSTAVHSDPSGNKAYGDGIRRLRSFGKALHCAETGFKIVKQFPKGGFLAGGDGVRAADESDHY
ncbi:MAG: hypothetical protein JWM59_502 [Verrucomicrobiales bacterium]|nr:hypothetical protein [Verrucomicrobiales bacterium]